MPQKFPGATRRDFTRRVKGPRLTTPDFPHDFPTHIQYVSTALFCSLACPAQKIRPTYSVDGSLRTLSATGTVCAVRLRGASGRVTAVPRHVTISSNEWRPSTSRLRMRPASISSACAANSARACSRTEAAVGSSVPARLRRHWRYSRRASRPASETRRLSLRPAGSLEASLLRQSIPQAAPGSGQPRPINRLGGSGRPTPALFCAYLQARGDRGVISRVDQRLVVLPLLRLALAPSRDPE